MALVHGLLDRLAAEGDAWLTPKLFRIGASTVTNDLLMQLAKEASGRYQNEDYFTKD